MCTTTHNLVILAEYSTDLEAAMVIAALEREGIEAFIKGEYTAGFRAEAPSWPKVEVRESDYERARALLDTFKQSQQRESKEGADDAAEEASQSSWNWFCRELVTLYLITVGIAFAYSIAQVFGWP